MTLCRQVGTTALMKKLVVEKDLDQLRYATRCYGVIAAWSGAGLFKALADRQPHAVTDLPGETRAIRQTASILAHAGLLVCHGDTIALTGAGHGLFESGGLNLINAESALGDLSRLDDVLALGGPAQAQDGSSRVTEGGVREQDPEGARSFMGMLYRRSENSAAEVSRWLQQKLPQGAHVLDLGGGHGRYGDELVKAGYRVTLYDRPICVQIAQERYGDTLNYLRGDFMSDPLGGPYDAVLLSNIVHGLGPDENEALFKRLNEVMNPGALLVLKDMFIGEHRAYPVEAAFFNLTMLMYTREGRSYTLADMAKLYGAAGFTHNDHIYVPDNSFSLLIAQKQS